MISSKTIDLSILSNYKSSAYTNTIGVIENYSDLRQYIGSEYCLIGGEQNRSPLVEDNGMIKYDNSNSYAQTNEWIPIGDLKVTRVTLKYQKPYTSNTSWYKFSIFLSKLSDTDNEVYTSVVVNDTSTQSQTWYDVDVDFNSIEVNYFKVNAIVGRAFIKDIVIYYQDDEPKSGGAGSGYIGNSLLSNKKMVGYNVPTSSAEGTKTESVNEVSASAVSGKPKSGNGFARIKFLREPDVYWISQYTVGGTTYNLMQIGDVTIPDSIINATQMTCTEITGRSSTIPSFVTNLGDLIFDLQSSIDADVTLEFINNSFLRFLFGRYNYITSGTRMNGSQYYDVANSRVFYQSGWANWVDGKVKYYIAIKIDKVNHRAYMIVLEHTYYHWAGNIGYIAYAIGGMPNGVDLLYETFKDVR